MDLLFRLNKDIEGFENEKNSKNFFTKTLPNSNGSFFYNINFFNKLEKGETIYFAYDGKIIAKATFSGEKKKNEKRERFKFGHKVNKITIVESQQKINRTIFKGRQIEYINSNEKTKEIERLLKEKQTIYENDGEAFEISNTDRRENVIRQIKERRGQTIFRNALRERYGDLCLVTGCKILSIVEAAHISWYRGVEDNHPTNGLLLRADIHTLFDLELIGITPDTLEIAINPTIADEYGFLKDRKLLTPEGTSPSKEALQHRYEAFLEKLATAE